MPGIGGRCSCLIPATTFEIEGPCSQGFEGEVVVVFGAVSQTSKVFKTIEFLVRKGF